RLPRQTGSRMDWRGARRCCPGAGDVPCIAMQRGRRTSATTTGTNGGWWDGGDARATGGWRA
ncbi:MAG: hypothetical protein ACOVRM_06605, partial [Planctomycetaceae bacterium]